MQLEFQYSQQVATGKNGDLIHFENNDAKLFYLDSSGNMMTIDTTTPLGAWDSRTFDDPVKVCEDDGISNMMVSNVPRYNAYGSWLSENRHRFAIYSPMYEVGEYIENGEIGYSIDTPIATLSLELNNPDQAFISEDQLGFLAPGAKIVLDFQSGDSDEYSMGVFYVDSSDFAVLNETISTNARNTIGKFLKDQSFDENYNYNLQNLKTLITAILTNAGLKNETNKPVQFKISDITEQRGISYPYDMDMLQGIQELLKTISDWKISETPDGVIIVGSSSYTEHIQPGKYTFYRDTDIWSRSVKRDDAEAYKRVCVHTSNNSVQIYKSVTQFEKWGMGAHKTLYVQIPDGTTSADAITYATELAGRIANLGVIESFAGPFRPHLMPGDGAEIIGTDGKSNLLGLITEVKHHFGKGGFYTEFTVDSGGKIGKGRISDYIDKINRKKQKGNVIRLY